MNIVFDLGGVVVAWEPDKLIAAVFPDESMHDLVRDEVLFQSDWHDLDRGTLELGPAIERASARSGLPKADIERLMAAVPPSLRPMPETIDLIGAVRAKGNGVYALSNMPHHSIDYVEKHLTVLDLFDAAVISCRIGLVKPEPQIYRYLLDLHGLTAAETVFIDDTQINVTAAADVGLHAVRFESAGQCRRELEALGCL
jgi:putative hydrolase of the HAD superfamily